MMCDGLEKCPGHRAIAVNAQRGEGEGAEEPRPRRPLVIHAVALGRSALVASAVAGLGGAQAAQAERGEQVAPAGLDHPALTLGAERALGERDGKNLIGTERRLVAPGPVEHVEAAATLLVPEPGEGSTHAVGERVPGAG